MNGTNRTSVQTSGTARVSGLVSGLSGRTHFWSPGGDADALMNALTANTLTEAARQIRARLGEWPAARTAWRICVVSAEGACGGTDVLDAPDGPDTPGRGDLVVMTDAGARGDALRVQPQREWQEQRARAMSQAKPVPAQAAQQVETTQCAQSAQQESARQPESPRPAQWRQWLARGAAVIDTTAGRATLHLDGERYALENSPPKPAKAWLAALAAFLDCGFAPHDALTLALAWQDDDGHDRGKSDKRHECGDGQPADCEYECDGGERHDGKSADSECSRNEHDHSQHNPDRRADHDRERERNHGKFAGSEHDRNESSHSEHPRTHASLRAEHPRGSMIASAWPVSLAHFPRLADLPPAPAQPFAPCPAKLGLYPVLPSADWVERALDCGVKTVQLRSKQPKSAALQREIERSVEAGRRHHARVFINDHWREALAAGAYGVHLGQEDVRTADLAALNAAGLRLGLSTHGYYEMLRALHFRPSYIALGAIFPTTTKAMPTAPQGLARLAHYVKLLDGTVPLVAIGGIDAATLPAVLATGVGSAAVVRAVTEADDPAVAMALLQRLFAR